MNFGIKTGFNEAFIIDGITRNEIVDKCPEADEIIRPILRGRDLERFKVNWQNMYVIATFPSLNIDIEKYPAIKDYLLTFGKNRLNQNGEINSRKKTSNKWYETQDQINYWRDFLSPKIIWGEISDLSKFVYDESGYYAEATTFVMTGDKLKYLISILNSKLCEWYFNQIGTATGVGTNRWKKYTIEKIPIIVPSVDSQYKLEKLVEQITDHSTLNIRRSIENEINNIVYEMYELTPEEISFFAKL